MLGVVQDSLPPPGRSSCALWIGEVKKESGAGAVAVQGEDIYCTISNITDVCYQIEVVF